MLFDPCYHFESEIEVDWRFGVEVEVEVETKVRKERKWRYWWAVLIESHCYFGSGLDVEEDWGD